MYPQRQTWIWKICWSPNWFFTDVSTTDEKKRWEEYCGKTTNLIPNESLTFQGKNNFGTEKCIIRLKTDPGYLLRLNIRYVPDISGCSHSYLHIGNDAYRTDVDSLTSYKFCDVVWDLEVVSRSEFLWIVYNNSGNVKHSHEKQEIGVQVLKEGRPKYIQQSYAAMRIQPHLVGAYFQIVNIGTVLSFTSRQLVSKHHLCEISDNFFQYS